MESDMTPIDDSYDQPSQPFYQGDTEPQQQYYHQTQPMYMHQPQEPPQPQKKGLFSDIDKTTWIIIGLLVLIAFFMGKTMQPVIIRTS